MRPVPNDSLLIATWNVNSVKARLGIVVDWLKAFAPDVALLQELKCEADAFPRLEIEAAGYRAEVVGQKSYNGVAILARHPIDEVITDLPGDGEDEQARYVEATVAGVRVASIYLPNGNPVPGPKFDYKLDWMKRLSTHAAALLDSERPIVLGGDYNVCPTDADCWDPAFMRDDALCQPESRAAFRTVLHQGYTDALRLQHTGPHLYSYWDYQAGRWQRDEGLRIDHLLLSPQAADRLVDTGVDKTPRDKEKPSDHTPVWCRLTMNASN